MQNILRSTKKVFIGLVAVICLLAMCGSMVVCAGEDNTEYRAVVEALEGASTMRDLFTVKDENGKESVMSQIYYPTVGVGMGDGDTLCLAQGSLSNLILMDGNTPSAYLSLNGASFGVSSRDYKLIQGVILIEAITDVAITSKTQTLHVKSGAVALLHVDSYGNAFNYCISGTLDIQSVGKKNASLNEGEYVAVTVKRDLKDIRDYTDEEIKDITMPSKGWDYVSSIVNPLEKVTLDITELEKINVLTIDGELENGVIDNVKTDTLYLVYAPSYVGHTIYVDFKVGEARVITLKSLLDIDKDSNESPRALKAYVDQTMAPGDELYIYISTADDSIEAVTLKYDKNRTIYERSYQLFKSLLLPAGVAFVLLVIVLLVINKRKKTALEWEETVKREAQKNK